MSEEKDARWVNPAVMRPVCQAEALRVDRKNTRHFSPAPGEHASWSPQGPPLTDTLRLECARTLGGRPLRSTPEQGQGRVV